MRRLKLIFFLSIALLIKTELYSITPEEAFLLSLKNNPKIKALKAALNRAEIGLKKAQSAYLPEVLFTVNYRRVGVIPEFDMPMAGKIRFGTENNYFFQVQGRYLIFDWGRRGLIKELSNNGKILSKASLTSLKKRLSYSIAGIFLAYNTLHQTEEGLKENLKLFKAHLDVSKKMYSEGMVSSYDVLSTKIKIENIKTEIDEIEKAKSSLIFELEGIVGEKIDSIDFENYRIPLKNLSIDYLTKEALKNREDLFIYSVQEKSLDVQKKLVKIKNLPQIASTVNFMLQNGMLPDLNELRTNWNIVVSANMTLFDGSKSKWELKEIEKELEQLSQEFKGKTLELKTEIKKAVSNLNFLMKKLIKDRSNVKLAEESLKIVKESYTKGEASNIDVLKSINELKFAKLSVIKTEMEIEKEKLNILILTGKTPWRIK